ncbi:MAG: response regulator [Acidobacteriota bacterium]|jgi:DNA-binding NtrC family response regulator
MTEKLEILILDDEEIVCTRLKSPLEKSGYAVEIFKDSREAKARIEQHRFDIIVTDLKMAHIDGLQLFQLAHDRWPDCEILIITGFATVDVTREALHKGVRDVIAKPFKIADFIKMIDQIAEEIQEKYN